MNRMGIYTGSIYMNGETPEVGECCVCVSDEQLKDEEYMKELRERKHLYCNNCFGCPASCQKRKINKDLDRLQVEKIILENIIRRVEICGETSEGQLDLLQKELLKIEGNIAEYKRRLNE